jgi:site-specific recombinase
MLEEMTQLPDLQKKSPNSKKSIRAALWKRLSVWLRLRDPRRDLSSILESCDPRASLQDRILWLSQLVHWIRGTAVLENQAKGSAIRVRFLLQLLERKEEWRTSVGATVLSVLRDTEAPSLFAQTGLTEQAGFISEILRRSVDSFLPPAPRPNELGYAVEMIFTDDNDIEWLEALTDEDWQKIGELVLSGEAIVRENGGIPQTMSLMNDLQDAVVKLSVQAAAIGFSSDVRDRFRTASHDPSAPSPFLALNRAAVQYREGGTDGSDLRATVAVCEMAVQSVFQRIDSSGVSVQLVYHLETVTGLLKRLELLLGFADSAATDADHFFTARLLLIEIVRTRIERRSVRSLFRLNFDLFARKLVEHAGETGEHYITRTPREYWEMFKAGAGGGAITVIMTMAKFAIGALKLPLFFEGLAAAINYSVSFLAIQAFGFALATKQPSMTAAALAGRLRNETHENSKLADFVTLVAQITRSQFIAAIGNVGICFPLAWATDWVFERVFGHHVLSAIYASHALETFHPWHSLTVFYAALTGVLLWLSSFGAGWLQNWVIYRRIPEAITVDRTLQNTIGEKRTFEIAEFIRHNSAGWGGNVAIGFLLAFVPIIGKIFGLLLDVRHITLTAGYMGFALRALPEASRPPSLWATMALSLVLIGSMNIGISTLCALIVAIRARRASRTRFRALLAAVRKSFLRNPLPFFFPPRQARAVEPQPPPSGE